MGFRAQERLQSLKWASTPPARAMVPLLAPWCSPLVDFLPALEVRGQVAHAVHGLHQLPQVWLDLEQEENARGWGRGTVLEQRSQCGCG